MLFLNDYKPLFGIVSAPVRLGTIEAAAKSVAWYPMWSSNGCMPFGPLRLVKVSTVRYDSVLVPGIMISLLPL